MNYRNGLLLIFLLSIQLAQAQIGGNSTYMFLDQTAAARTSALGGTFISIKDDDINLALQNPSLLTPAMGGAMAFNGMFYPGSIRFGDVAYAVDKKDAGVFMASMHYVDYGSMLEADNTGLITGSFKAAEYALNIGWAKPISLDSMISIGAQIKFIYSDLYLYNSFGAAADISATYYNPENEFSVAVVARNIGAQIKTYTPMDHEPLPTEVLAAVSQRMEHVPFRATLTVRHLERWDISYLPPDVATTYDPVTGETTFTSLSWWGKFRRHFIMQGEILLSKNFNLRAAYNLERKDELALETTSSAAGWSFGFGLKISHFQLSYGRAIYSIAGGLDTFSITTNIHDFIH